MARGAEIDVLREGVKLAECKRFTAPNFSNEWIWRLRDHIEPISEISLHFLTNHCCKQLQLHNWASCGNTTLKCTSWKGYQSSYIPQFSTLHTFCLLHYWDNLGYVNIFQPRTDSDGFPVWTDWSLFRMCSCSCRSFCVCCLAAFQAQVESMAARLFFLLRGLEPKWYIGGLCPECIWDDFTL